MITCGNPAVPTMSANVMANTSIIDFLPFTNAAVYSGNPRSRWILSIASNRYIPAFSPSRTRDPNPNCGIALPVI